MPPVTITAANTTISVKAADMVAAALLLMNVSAAGEVLSAAQMSWGLENLQRRIDLINAQKPMIYNINFNVVNFLANHTPNTIGPTGDFNFPNPPVSIESAALILTSGSTQQDLPMRVLTGAEWREKAIKNLTSTLPTELFYSREFPLGNIYLWPVPTVAGQLRLELWSNIPQALANTTLLAMPPAYWAYLTRALATDISSSYGQEAMATVQSPAFMQQYREARNAITSNNLEAPPLKSDAPISGTGSLIPDFNYLTRQRG